MTILHHYYFTTLSYLVWTFAFLSIANIDLVDGLGTLQNLSGVNQQEYAIQVLKNREEYILVKIESMIRPIPFINKDFTLAFYRLRFSTNVMDTNILLKSLISNLSFKNHVIFFDRFLLRRCKCKLHYSVTQKSGSFKSKINR